MATDVLPKRNSEMRSKSRPLTLQRSARGVYVIARRICAGDVTIERMGFSLSRRIDGEFRPRWTTS